jgi:hypothetical protein
VYVVETVGGDIDDSIAALPPDLQPGFAELRAALEVSPWTVGTPLVPSNPTGLRVATIGASSTGTVVYHVLERDRRVAIVQVSFI